MVELGALRPDPKNARKRTERSREMLSRSLSDFGAGRSVLVDEDLKLIAGHGTVEAAAEVGIENVLVVPADANTLVAVQRTDLTERQKIELGIADNRTSDLSVWDGERLEALAEDDQLDLTFWFTEDEYAAIVEGEEEETPPGPGESDPTDQLTIQLRFPDADARQLFLHAVSQLAVLVPQVETTEARLQFVIDRFIAHQGDLDSGAKGQWKTAPRRGRRGQQEGEGGPT